VESLLKPEALRINRAKKEGEITAQTGQKIQSQRPCIGVGKTKPKRDRVTANEGSNMSY
jgi:hypothetical protein